jgi:hypothetical protein
MGLEIMWKNKQKQFVMLQIDKVAGSLARNKIACTAKLKRKYQSIQLLL